MAPGREHPSLPRGVASWRGGCQARAPPSGPSARGGAVEDSQRDDWTPDPTEHPEPESSASRARRRAVEIAQDSRFCMVTSSAADGALHARPMTPQQVTDDLEAWFFISGTSEQAADIA